MNTPSPSCKAFQGTKRIASGTIQDVARKVKDVLDRDRTAQIIIFDDQTSEPVEIDFRGTPAEIAKGLETMTREPQPEAPEPQSPDPEPRRPGRPKLGVIPREITLLPRHWDWLATQPGGASVALRKLVEQAIKTNRNRDSIRRAQNATYRFVSAMAGNEPMYEEAIRALFGNQHKRFLGTIQAWPSDVREHTKHLAANAFTVEDATEPKQK